MLLKTPRHLRSAQYLVFGAKQIYRELAVLLSRIASLCFALAETHHESFQKSLNAVLDGHMSRKSDGVWQDKKKALSKTCQQKYLMCSEFLVDQGVDLLKQDVEAAVSKTLGIKSLRDLCSLADLRDIFLNICLNLEHSQVEWLSDIILKKSVPEHALTPDETETYEQLLGETRDIVQSQEFKVVLAASLKVVLDGVIQEFETEFKDKEFNRVHLAKLLPPVSCIGTLLLEHPDENRFIRSITGLQEMQSFCNLVYSTSGQSRESDL